MSRTILTMLIFLSSSVGLGRFNHNDVESVDSERNRTIEAFNDEVGYRFPLFWQDRWSEYKTGFRVSAGSLNANRFLYREHIKFFDEHERFALGINREVYEDKVTMLESNQIDFIFKPTSFLNFLIVGDTNTYKKWSDLAVGLSLKNSDVYELIARFWYVDNYYNSKEEVDGDYYEKETRTYDLSLIARFDKSLALNLFLEHDSPLKWVRNSQHYNYEYSKSLLKADLTYKTDQSSLKTFMYYEHKKESKNTLILAPTQFSESTEIKRAKIGAQYSLKTKSDEIIYGMEALQIESNNSYSGTAVVGTELDVDGFENLSGKRDEVIIFAERNYDVQNEVSFGLGYYINPVDTDIDKDESNIEQKLKTSLSYKIADNAMMLFNLSWDMDRVFSAYPYDDKPFEPWGGGAGQIMYVF